MNLISNEIDRLVKRQEKSVKQKKNLKKEIIKLGGMIEAYAKIKGLKAPVHNTSNEKPNANLRRGSVSYEKNNDEIEVIGC